MPGARGMGQAHIEDFVVGALFAALGAIYIVRARGMRDFGIRMMQREGYIVFTRAVGAFLLLTGLAVLVAWARRRSLL